MLNWIVLSLAIASADSEAVTYVHTDAFGSPVAVEDSNGNMVERFAYEPYGSVVVFDSNLSIRTAEFLWLRGIPHAATES
ncbi:hypothetical protein [Stenotrophomonas maltophilia]|uniref:hypothetical protein n=1 Tax=Stenotrophomonas maltophilia TaxID=40324 RepID=UPI0034DB3BBF